MHSRSKESFMSSGSQSRTLRAGFAGAKGVGVSQIFTRARIWLCLTEECLLVFKDSTSKKPILNLPLSDIIEVSSESSKPYLLRIHCSRHKDILLTFKSGSEARPWLYDLEQCLQPVLCIGNNIDFRPPISDYLGTESLAVAEACMEKSDEGDIRVTSSSNEGTIPEKREKPGSNPQRSRSPKRDSKDSAFSALSASTFALSTISGATWNTSQTSFQSFPEFSKHWGLAEYIPEAEYFPLADADEAEGSSGEIQGEGETVGVRPPSPVDPDLVFDFERVYISVSESPTSPRDERQVDDLTGKVDKLYEHPSAAGGYSDIWKGHLKLSRGEQIVVAIKVIRAFAFEESKLEKVRHRLDKELDIWRRLQHPNIVPLLGTVKGFGKFPSMISPWLPNGNAGKYLENLEPCQSLSARLKLLYDVASGVEYLHSFFPSIVHGDLKASNVLVSEEGEALVTDFGISRVFEEASNGSHSGSSFNGSIRWMAVELVRGFVTDRDSSSESVQINTATDVWAFGSTVLEILSGKLPYVYRKRDEHVMHEIWNGLLPLRDGNRNVYPNVTEKIANFLYKCWSEDPTVRPSITEAKDFIHSALREQRRMGVIMEEETIE